MVSLGRAEVAAYSFWALGASQITVSGGGQLSGITQGDGTHLIGRTITLNSSNFEQIGINDAGADTTFDDNDGNQRLLATQSFDGQTYAQSTMVEAEFEVLLRDPATGETFRALAVNFNNSNPSYATIEGLAFIDRLPPRDVALEVVSAGEGPGSGSRPPIENVEIATPACFTPGTLIETVRGARPVETLRVGDRVLTRDSGPQPLIWVGRTRLGRAALAANPGSRPVRILRHAFGPDRPNRTMLVSPRHRVLLEGPRAQLCYGEDEVLAAAAHLVDDARVRVADDVTDVTYIHLQCPAHEILSSDGLPSESFNPGPSVLGSFSPLARARLLAAVPSLARAGDMALRSARPILRRHEAALWALRNRERFPLASALELC
ncbi:MAG: Hint domain-containing protein [Rhodobacteraceae bacterium]|nr:MAG: Hint domain-containing protein [Paracoccaceae bacterium]